MIEPAMTSSEKTALWTISTMGLTPICIHFKLIISYYKEIIFIVIGVKWWENIFKLAFNKL